MTCSINKQIFLEVLLKNNDCPLKKKCFKLFIDFFKLNYLNRSLQVVKQFAQVFKLIVKITGYKIVID